MDLIAFVISTKKINNKFIKFLLSLLTSPRNVDRQNIPKTLAPTKIAQRQTYFFCEPTGAVPIPRFVEFVLIFTTTPLPPTCASAREPSNAKVIIASHRKSLCVMHAPKQKILKTLASGQLWFSKPESEGQPGVQLSCLPSTGNSSEISIFWALAVEIHNFALYDCGESFRLEKFTDKGQKAEQISCRVLVWNQHQYMLISDASRFYLCFAH